MRIRSISYFFAGNPLEDRARLLEAGNFLASARKRFEGEGLEVQTVRLVLGEPARIAPAELVSYATGVEDLCKEASIDYATIGALRASDSADHWRAIPDMLRSTERMFAAGILLNEKGVDLAAVRLAAEVVHRNAAASDDGFQNLRFATLGRVPAGVPFLPAAYQEGPSDHFSIATEAADVAVRAFDEALDLEDARRRFLDLMHAKGGKVVELSNATSEEAGIEFGGIDFSLAPFPRPQDSIGGALEKLGVPILGQSGTTALSAFLTSCLDAVELPRCGFCGLFLPVLEDTVLAQRASDGHLGVTELLLASTVCGTGLDTLPLAGDVGEESLAAILLDMAAISARLDKPLTARLMPMPNKKAGDALEFDFPYFASGRVVAHGGGRLSGLLGKLDTLPVDPRRKR